MIKSVTINGFRGFKDFQLKDLAPITLIAGRNNSGKSSILEALLLAMDFSGAEVLHNLLVWRGLPAEKISDYESLFNQTGELSQAKITLDFEGETRTLDLMRVKPELVVESMSGEPISMDGSIDSFIQTEEHVLSRMRVSTVSSNESQYDETVYAFGQSANGLAFTCPKKELAVKGAYVGPHIRSYGHKTLVDLYLNNWFEPINEAMRLIDPRVKEVSPADGCIVALVEGVQKRIPLNALGDGMVKCAHCLGQVLKTPIGGTCAFDEIENGLHYSAMKIFAGALVSEAMKRNVQLVITTHSLEMLHAFKQATSGLESGKFLYLKMGCRKSGQIVYERYNYEAFCAHLEKDFELR